MRLDKEAIYLTYVAGPSQGVKADFQTIWGVGQIEDMDWGWLNPARTVALMKKDMSLEELMRMFSCKIVYYLGRWRFNRRKGAKGNNVRIEIEDNGRRMTFRYQIDLIKPCLKLIGREVDIYLLMKDMSDFALLVLSNGVGTLVIAPTTDLNAHYRLEDLAKLVKAPEEVYGPMIENSGIIEEAIERWARELGVMA